jgi:hypothetical protein
MRRLGEMAGRWREEVQSGHRLVRWMLRPEDSRMYEGFCRLEASPQGNLDHLFVFFYTPFVEAVEFSYAIMSDWLREYTGNAEQRAALAAAGIKGEWDVAVYRRAVDERAFAACDALLPSMLDAWRGWLGMPEAAIVLALLPKQMGAPAGFVSWLTEWRRRPGPEGVQLLVFDHSTGNFWGEVFDRGGEDCCTLRHELRMEEAIREIATAGAATDPQAAFRECLFEMGAAAAAKDRQRLEDWGEKALVLGRKSKDELLLGTAYLSYAGMLFPFKAHLRIDVLLEGGFAVCRRGVERGEGSMRSLLLQYYAYKGSHCQLRRQRKEALDWFMRMGTEAEEFGYWSQALSAYYKTFVFARYKHFEEEQRLAVQRAMELTDRLSSDEIVAGEYPFLALEFMQGLAPTELSRNVEGKMMEVFGPGWRQTVEELEKNYTRQKLREVESEAMAED